MSCGQALKSHLIQGDFLCRFMNMPAGHGPTPGGRAEAGGGVVERMYALPGAGPSKLMSAAGVRVKGGGARMAGEEPRCSTGACPACLPD